MNVAIQSVVGVAMVPEAILEKLEPIGYSKCAWTIFVCACVHEWWVVLTFLNTRVSLHYFVLIFLILTFRWNCCLVSNVSDFIASSLYGLGL